MPIDPITIMMFALIAILIFFMFRNGKKRQAAMQELQNGLRPGAEVMLQSGIFGTIESIDEADNRVTLRSGTTTLEVHRNAISQIVAPTEAPADAAAATGLAPDDDPEFGERIAGAKDAPATETPSLDAPAEANDPSVEIDPKSDGEPGETPKA